MHAILLTSMEGMNSSGLYYVVNKNRGHIIIIMVIMVNA